jgi:hypothetical protein
MSRQQVLFLPSVRPVLYANPSETHIYILLIRFVHYSEEPVARGCHGLWRQLVVQLKRIILEKSSINA